VKPPAAVRQQDFRQSGNPGHLFGAPAGAAVTPVTVPAPADA
jgi:hypothetical protein